MGDRLINEEVVRKYATWTDHLVDAGSDATPQ